ncbi:MAG: molybdopterin dinucleotide binding domain-containing protein [Nitrososphaerales archaeon]|jgi:formylmethanofuran dehydrogenase subunit D|nr:molybdopterin dinucleotide binding domain-containing protein [Nitrososphaerales archaeon]|tara:strand:- start:128 stop:514 length:387 start_codon:yes stop_codon:yes gene_type:complete
MTGIKVKVLSGRTLRQGVGKEAGKNSERYRTSVSICEMNSEDITSLSIKAGENVKVTSAHGSVVLKSVSSNQLTKPGMIFIPYGLYANQLFNETTGGSGMPTFKGEPAVVESAIEEPVKTLEELITEI